ncbi:MAG: hypothetical protein JNM13_10980 [Hyphomicrobiaceae bacterium]|nr:hypothetical protein [Hyphomicrobiaceae bacterium]
MSQSFARNRSRLHFGAAALLLAVSTGLAPLPVGAAGPDFLAGSVVSLPADIEDVRVVGNWTDAEGKTGVYRIVVVRTGSSTIVARLFVQWLTYPVGGTSGEVLSTVEIDQVRQLGANIVDYTFEDGGSELQIHLTLSKAGDADREYEVIIRAADDYRFEPAGN